MKSRKRSKSASTGLRKKKNMWSDNEDHELKILVVKHSKQWTSIAKKMRGRSAKQCRERYVNHLNPNLKKGNWTEEEISKIESLQKEFGNQWSKIAANIEGRTDNDVKNYWYSKKRSEGVRTKAIVKPTTNTSKSDWTEQEDIKLMELHGHLGNRWKDISSKIPGRSVGQVKRRVDQIRAQGFPVQVAGTKEVQGENASIKAYEAAASYNPSHIASDLMNELGCAPEPSTLPVENRKFVNLLPGFSVGRHVNARYMVPFSPLERPKVAKSTIPRPDCPSNKNIVKANTNLKSCSDVAMPTRIESMRSNFEPLLQSLRECSQANTPKRFTPLDCSSQRRKSPLEASECRYTSTLEESPCAEIDHYFSRIEHDGPTLGVMKDGSATPMRTPPHLCVLSTQALFQL